jgi:acyl-coenzyme A synthetase/AMP-(fatty) acid ligase/acyl carrier protein
MIGGEPFPINLLTTLQRKTTAKIYNMYGPTETTIWSSISDVTHKDRIDIGTPIKNTQILIIDDNLHILDGQDGEIAISGDGLAKGYHGDDELTARKFVFLPQIPNMRVYRTGDLGHYLPDGNLECLGRMDNQVKIRGFRIELEEIESYINSFSGISQSIVKKIDINESDSILEAFYISESDVNLEILKDYLRSSLPEPMIPVKFNRITAFSYLPNGKINRKIIDEANVVPISGNANNECLSDKLSELQQKAFTIIKSNFKENLINDISLDTNLLDIGINSITFINIVISLEAAFDFEFDDDMLILEKLPDICNIIKYVESKIT